MNTKNNKRRRASVEKIEKAFIELLQGQELKEITVSDICKATDLNRSTFYANFVDIYDLADKLREKLEQDFSLLFQDEATRERDGAVAMFRHIQENQILYKTYFKLGYENRQQIMTYDPRRAQRDFNNQHLEYHIEFFRNGLNAIIKLWLAGGCRETPEEMAEILKLEYQGR